MPTNKRVRPVWANISITWNIRSTSAVFYSTKTWKRFCIEAHPNGRFELQREGQEYLTRVLFFRRLRRYCAIRALPRMDCIVTRWCYLLRRGHAFSWVPADCLFLA